MSTYLPLTLVGSLCLGIPHAGLAQTTESASLPKYYVGLAAYTSESQALNSYYLRNGFGIPVQATFGYQFRPRWAIQAGLTYWGFSYNYSYTENKYLGNGQYGAPIAVSEADRYRTFSASALARYTLTRTAAHRMQFDLLGGLTLEHYRSSSRNTRTDSTAAPVTNEYGYRYSRLFATAGLGLRYRFSQHLEATYNLLLGYGFDRFAYPTYYDHISSSMALGLQYRFGQ